MLIPASHPHVTSPISNNFYIISFLVLYISAFPDSYNQRSTSDLKTTLLVLKIHIGDEDTSATMAAHGTIGEFQNTQESWQSYVDRYFVANDVKTTDKLRTVLLSAVGGQTSQLIRNLLAPTTPMMVTFADAVQKHVQPRPSIKFNFHSRARCQGEDVSTYVAELSEHCNFGTALNEMLRCAALWTSAFNADSSQNHTSHLQRHWSLPKPQTGTLEHLTEGYSDTQNRKKST